MKLGEWLTGESARFWTALVVGSGVGFMAAYGREQHEGRAPSRRWVVNRLLAMPFLALMAAAGAEAFALPSRVATFLAALFSLLSYELIRVVTTRSLKRAADKIDELVKAGETVAELDAMPETPPVTHVKIETRADLIGAAVRTVATPEGPTPPDMAEMLKQLPDG